jgi:plasmid stabilization system protein ParE
MGKKIIWSTNALDQLEDIHFYIFFESNAVSYQITSNIIYILRVRHNAQKTKKHSWKV